MSNVLFAATWSSPDHLATVILLATLLCGLVSTMNVKNLIPQSNVQSATSLYVRPVNPLLDLKQIVFIDRLCFPYAQQRHVEDVQDEITTGCRVLVVDHPQYGLIGYVVYYMEPRKRVEIRRIAVQPAAHRCGYGSDLIRSVMLDAATNDIDDMICDVPEDCLAVQLFLKKLGFRHQRTFHPDKTSPSKTGRDTLVSESDTYRLGLSLDTVCPAHQS